MSSNYPTSLDTLATNKANSTPMTDDHALHHDDLADAVNKIESTWPVDISARIDGRGPVWTSGASKFVFRERGQRVNVRDYGALGDGASGTVDTAAWQQALDTAAAFAINSGEAVTVFGRPGDHYNIITPLQGSSGVTVDLMGSTLDGTGLSYQEGPIIQWVGTEVASGVGYEALTATANEGDTWVTVANGQETEFADGTWVKLASSDLFDTAFKDGEINIVDIPTCAVQAMTASQTTALTGVSMFTNPPSGSPNLYAGVFPNSGTLQIDNEQMTYNDHGAAGNGVEFRGIVRGVNGTTAATHSVRSIARLVGPAGRVWLRWPIQGGAYSTSPYIAAMTMKENVGIRNGTLLGPGPHAESGTGVQFDRCVQARAENLQVKNCTTIGIDFVDTVDGLAHGNHVSGSRLANGSINLGYGVRVVNASQDITVAHNTIRMCRHASATGSDARGGVVRRLTYIGNHVLDISLDAFDTHSPTDQVTWIGNTVVGCGAGILFNGPRMKAIGNRVSHCGTNGINCSNNTLRPTEWEIANNRIHTCVNYGIGIAPTGSVDPVCHFINIADNVIWQSSLSGIRAATGLTNTWKGLSITGNTVANIAAGSSNIGIEIQKADGCVIAGNCLTGLTTSNVGIKLTTVNKAAVTGNAISFLSTTGNGIQGVTAIDCTFIGNTVTTATNGITLDAASTNNTVMGNNVRGCTTPITNSGSANILSTADASGAYNRT